MKLTTYSDAKAFLTAVEPALMLEEAKSNLMLGIARAVDEGKSYGDELPYFLAVFDGPGVAAAAIRTPPYNLILHGHADRPEAITQIVDFLAVHDHGIPGAHGEVPVATAFAQQWTARTGVASRIEMSQRAYCLTEVTLPSGVRGIMRLGAERDLETLIAWFLGFCAEAVPDDPPKDPEESVRRFMGARTLAVWDDEGIVSMAGSSRHSGSAAAVNAVYTPPRHRGNGYATACVAGLSQLLLDRGAQFCTLFTDLSNPTSNKIYQRVGYDPVADFVMMQFGDSGSGGG